MKVVEWLNGLAQADQSTEEDARMMMGLLRKVGFGRAVCTGGIVYLKGQGTIDAPPTSIHAIAHMMLKQQH